MKTSKLIILSALLATALAGCNSSNKSEEEKKEDEVVDNENYDYVLLAQPVVAAVLGQRSYFSVSNNVQADYKSKSGNLEITQASVFVRNGVDESKVNSFLSMISGEISTLLADPETVLASATSSLEEQLVSGKIGGTVQLVSKLLKNNNQIGLGYKEALGNKAAIDAFIGNLGMSESQDSIYYTTATAEAASSVELKVACPAGAPALSLYNHLADSNVEIGAADTIVSYLTSGTSKDIVIMPTNAGISAINAGKADFKIAATVTFGNFFLVSTGNDTDETLNKGDKVLAFQENGVAGKLFKYVYGDKELDVTYVADAATAKNTILTQFN